MKDKEIEPSIGNRQTSVKEFNSYWILLGLGAIVATMILFELFVPKN